MAYNAQNKTGARVAIYVRVSTLHQIDRDSLPMQKQDLLAYAKLMLNTDDCVIFEDAGYSGKNTDRPRCRPAPAEAHGRVPPVPDRRSPPMGYTADSTQSHRT